MIVTATLQAELVTIPDVVNVAPHTVVALPPSDLDTAGLMRVIAGGASITRAFDSQS